MRIEITYESQIHGGLSNPCPRDGTVMVGSCACHMCGLNIKTGNGYVECSHGEKKPKSGKG